MATLFKTRRSNGRKIVCCYVIVPIGRYPKVIMHLLMLFIGEGLHCNDVTRFSARIRPSTDQMRTDADKANAARAMRAVGPTALTPPVNAAVILFQTSSLNSIRAQKQSESWATSAGY